MKNTRLSLKLSRKRKQKITSPQSRKRAVLGGSISAVVCAAFLAGAGSALAFAALDGNDRGSDAFRDPLEDPPGVVERGGGVG